MTHKTTQPTTSILTEQLTTKTQASERTCKDSSVRTDMQGPFEASCSHTQAPTKNQRCSIKTPNPQPQKWCRKTFTNQVPPKRASIVELHRPNHQRPYQSWIFSWKAPKKYKLAAPFFGPPGEPKNRPAKPATFTFPSYPKRRPQKQGRQTDPFLGLQIFPSTPQIATLTIAVLTRNSPWPAQWRPIVREPVLHTLFGIGFGDALCTVQLCLHGSHVETALKTQSALESTWNGGRRRPMEAALKMQFRLQLQLDGGQWRPMEAALKMQFTM